MSLWLKRYLYVVCAIVVLVVATAPVPQPSLSRVANSDQGWAVPTLTAVPPDYASTVRYLAQSKLWGGQAEAEAGADERASRWRIAGVTGQHAERYVIVQFGDDRIQQLKPKDQFPDGTVISDVRENGVCVILQGKRRFLPLVGQAPAIVW